MRPGTVIVLACLAVLALATAGIGVTAEASGTQSTAAPANATTGDVLIVNETGAMLTGEVIVESGAVGTARMEYRERSADSEWRRTRPRKFSAETRDRPRRWFGWNVTGLESGTTYEYRLHVETRNDTATGAVRTFTTNESAVGGPSTPTSPPCPSFRGVGPALCTTTPTPTPTDTPPQVADDASPSDSSESADDSSGWLAGVVPLLGWIAAVVVVAPAVLGGLLVLVSGRGGDDR